MKNLKTIRVNLKSHVISTGENSKLHKTFEAENSVSENSNDSEKDNLSKCLPEDELAAIPKQLLECWEKLRNEDEKKKNSNTIYDGSQIPVLISSQPTEVTVVKDVAHQKLVEYFLGSRSRNSLHVDKPVESRVTEKGSQIEYVYEYIYDEHKDENVGNAGKENLRSKNVLNKERIETESSKVILSKEIKEKNKMGKTDPKMFTGENATFPKRFDRIVVIGDERIPKINSKAGDTLQVFSKKGLELREVPTYLKQCNIYPVADISTLLIVNISIYNIIETFTVSSCKEQKHNELLLLKQKDHVNSSDITKMILNLHKSLSQSFTRVRFTSIIPVDLCEFNTRKLSQHRKETAHIVCENSFFCLKSYVYKLIILQVNSFVQKAKMGMKRHDWELFELADVDNILEYTTDGIKPTDETLSVMMGNLLNMQSRYCYSLELSNEDFFLIQEELKNNRIACETVGEKENFKLSSGSEKRLESKHLLIKDAMDISEIEDKERERSIERLEYKRKRCESSLSPESPKYKRWNSPGHGRFPMRSNSLESTRTSLSPRLKREDKSPNRRCTRSPLQSRNYPQLSPPLSRSYSYSNKTLQARTSKYSESPERYGSSKRYISPRRSPIRYKSPYRSRNSEISKRSRSRSPKRLKYSAKRNNSRSSRSPVRSQSPMQFRSPVRSRSPYKFKNFCDFDNQNKKHHYDNTPVKDENLHSYISKRELEKAMSPERFNYTKEKIYKNTLYEEDFKREVAEKAYNLKLKIDNRLIKDEISPKKERKDYLAFSKSNNSLTNEDENPYLEPETILALRNLSAVHKHECQLYRDSPASHPNYKREYYEFYQFQASKFAEMRIKPSEEQILEDWRKFWCFRLEELFENTWQDMKKECLNRLYEKKKKLENMLCIDNKSIKNPSHTSSEYAYSKDTSAHPITKLDEKNIKKLKKKKDKKCRKKKEKRRKSKERGKVESEVDIKTNKDGSKVKITKKKKKKLSDNDIDAFIKANRNKNSFRNLCVEIENKDKSLSNKKNMLIIDKDKKKVNKSITNDEAILEFGKEVSNNKSQSKEVLVLDCDIVKCLQGTSEIHNSNKDKISIDLINLDIQVKDNDSDDSIVCISDTHLNVRNNNIVTENIKESNKQVSLQNVVTIQPEVMLVDLLKDLTHIEKHLGLSLGVLITIIYQKVIELQTRGENTLSIFEDFNNVEILRLTIDRLDELLSDSITTIVQRAIYDETKRNVNALLNNAEKILFEGINIERIALTTIEREPSKVIAFIQSALSYDGKEHISEDKKLAIYMAIKNKQFEMLKGIPL